MGNLNIVKLHQLIDQWAADERATNEVKPAIEGEAVITPEAPERVLSKGQRVVRTKSQGDRVYLLDYNKKTRAWVTKPEILQALGFEMGDVVEVEDTEFLKYQMSAAIYK